MTLANPTYIKRINTAIEYIQTHVQQAPTLHQLAEVACFSPYHFHRIFRALTGETVHFFSMRTRLEKAAKLLSYSTLKLTDIAFECGFSSSSTFSRAFKNYFNISAQNFRKNGLPQNSKICKEHFPMDAYLLNWNEKRLYQTFPVKIKSLPKRRVAFIRVTNSYSGERVQKAFAQLASWAKSRDIFSTETLFGMSLNDPYVTPMEKCSYEVCITLPEKVVPLAESGILTMEMPATTYATTHVKGGIQLVATATHFLFTTWLISSQWQPAHQHGMEVYVKNEDVFNWEKFNLELCIPIKKM